MVLPFFPREQVLILSIRLTKLIDMITTTLKWSLVSGQPLQKWVDDSGKLLILGDAAHAMVPYMSQGRSLSLLVNTSPRCADDPTTT